MTRDPTGAIRQARLRKARALGYEYVAGYLPPRRAAKVRRWLDETGLEEEKPMLPMLNHVDAIRFGAAKWGRDDHENIVKLYVAMSETGLIPPLPPSVNGDARRYARAWIAQLNDPNDPLSWDFPSSARKEVTAAK